ncbi:MAG: MBL fold metallo-hydrolase [Saprospiraceae bacterium]|nr:MBL fold metallo-hydrolase [Saprospiraceae bacterium]
MLEQLDLNFLDSPETIACFLLKIPDGYALFETGPHSTFPVLLKLLAEKGIKLEEIKHVFLTHIHLDHAGAAWALAEAGANVYVHPRGYPHLLDPSKLLDSARRIYQDQMDYLWGQFKPIPEEQLFEVADLQSWKFGDTEVRAHYTPGHAVHHIAWQVGADLIAGDVAGVRIGKGPVMPPCPPPDINLDHWNESIDRIRELAPARVWLTHFGVVKNVETHLNELQQRLQDWANWIYPWFEKGTAASEIVPQFQEYVKNQLIEEGISGQELEKYEKANPAWMSVAGLLRYWYKKTNAQSK